MQEKLYDVLILGGGPAGLTAAIYTSRAHLSTLIVAGSTPGGQLIWTTDVENYPGFPDGVMGPDIVELFKKQALKFGSEHVSEDVKVLSGSAKEGFSVETTSGNTYKGKTVIIATGASAKWLDLPSVEKLRCKGISACATCDGFFFKDKVVAVVGAGDSAMEEATFLTKFSPKVYILARGEKGTLKASKFMLDRAEKNEKIEFLYGTEVIDVLGENSVEGIKIKDIKSGEEKVLGDVKGLFMAIGHKPNTDFLQGVLELGAQGYIQPIDNTKTAIEGLFVAGDVSDWKYRQAVTAAGLGCMAALDAERFLASKE